MHEFNSSTLVTPNENMHVGLLSVKRNSEVRYVTKLVRGYTILQFDGCNYVYCLYYIFLIRQLEDSV
jgi:hypothetical protein